jgi:hypothetical protein
MFRAMNTRKIMIYAHLGLAALFMPMLLLMPFTGAMYLWGFKGDEVKTEAFQLSAPIPENQADREQFFKDQFKQAGIEFKFESVNVSKTSVIFRPQTRDYYAASLGEGGGWTVSKVQPNLLKRLIEVHKGHGPNLMRIFESIFGMALILTTLSGLWLAWTVKPYRKVTLVSFGIGAAVIFVCLI